MNFLQENIANGYSSMNLFNVLAERTLNKKQSFWFKKAKVGIDTKILHTKTTYI